MTHTSTHTVTHVHELLAKSPSEFDKWTKRLTHANAQARLWDWSWWRRDNQKPPECDWRVWLLLAGRGFGKTRTGAEWVRGFAETKPKARIALVAATLGEARSIMVEGESGLLNIAPRTTQPSYESSLRRLTWPNGTVAMLYGASEPEMLRGPEHHAAWCDEIGKWPKAEIAWDNLMMTLRLGDRPQVVATTTPRAMPLIRRLLKEPGVFVTRGNTNANAANLARGWYRAMRTLYGGTRLGRQELGGEMIEDVEGALWTRNLIEQCRIAAGNTGNAGPTGDAGNADNADNAGKLARVVIGVDPPASARGDACGIIVAGLLRDGRLAVLEDASVEKPAPQQWAQAVAAAAARWSAERVIVEANMGGDMVVETLAAADVTLPVKPVHARHGKSRRAEPIALLYEKGRVVHIGAFPKLEDELAGFQIGGGYEGPSRSPDRADAAIWALAALIEGVRAGKGPVVRRM